MAIIDVREIEIYNPATHRAGFRPAYKTDEEKEDVIWMINEFGYKTLGWIGKSDYDIAIEVRPPFLESDETWLFAINID